MSLPTSRNFDRVSSTQDSHVKAGIFPIHNLPHSLTNCKIFLKKSVPDRKKYLRGVGMCFRCCDSAHFVKDCTRSLHVTFVVLKVITLFFMSRRRMAGRGGPVMIKSPWKNR